MKTCPFCKNDVPNDTVTCPFCSRTLIEKVGMQRKNEAKPRNTSTYKEKTVHYETYTEPKSQPQKEIKKSNKKYYPLIVLCIFVGLIVYDSLQPVETVSVVPSQSFPTQEVYQEAVISPNDNSLQNGTVFSQDGYYMNGLGELSIDNGTDYDNIVKLVHIGTDKSVYTAYIKAHSDFTIKKVIDGRYKLYFLSGRDWNSSVRGFNRYSSSSVFEEDFLFETTKVNEGWNTYDEYSKIKVTLHPVASGKAKTDSININDFARY